MPRGDLLATCKEIASTTPQMWLVAGSHLGFAEKLFKLRNDKVRGQVQGCHVERLCASWSSVSEEIAVPCILHVSQ